ncbi:hypothetical protein ACFL9T_04625 [Thermodesulfobacteriota bacterium]
MKRDARSVKKILENGPIEVSAPCRIDAGGTWDIKAMALPMAAIKPVTLNFSLNLRTRVTLTPYREGRVCMTSAGFSGKEEHAFENLPFNSVFGLYYAAIAYFGFHGLSVEIRSDSPVKAALGGSSTALIALIKALAGLSEMMGGRKLGAREILHLGYHLEDGVSGGNCGMQDQAAAVYGGVNLWTWQYDKPGLPLRRESLLDRRGRRELSKRLVVAGSGTSHVSIRINRHWVEDFMAGKTRTGWMEANAIVKALAKSIEAKNWREAAGLLGQEMGIRRRITPEALIPITAELIQQAEEMGCGARFAGAGAGGTVWALGELERIERLKNIWAEKLKPVRGGHVLNCHIDSRGVR